MNDALLKMTHDKSHATLKKENFFNLKKKITKKKTVKVIPPKTPQKTEESKDGLLMRNCRINFPINTHKKKNNK